MELIVFGFIIMGTVLGVHGGKEEGKREVMKHKVYCEVVQPYADGSYHKRCWRIKKVLDDEL